MTVDFPSKRDKEKTLSEGFFLNDQYFRVYEYSEQQKFSIFRCYKCQVFGHVNKTCKSLPKCGKCANQHPFGECEEGNAMKCANCQFNQTPNDPFCETDFNHASKFCKQRNIPNAGFQQTKVHSKTWLSFMAKVKSFHSCSSSFPDRQTRNEFHSKKHR